jgi:hypothetical protein
MVQLFIDELTFEITHQMTNSRAGESHQMSGQQGGTKV